ncbi:MAG: hypothetical protein FD146_34 [Anaerolineaceae bacterium]|nr:MAG: hypothetical protein FD146_34 [Anaerolineaceae bacterium]
MKRSLEKQMAVGFAILILLIAGKLDDPLALLTGAESAQRSISTKAPKED